MNGAGYVTLENRVAVSIVLRVKRQEATIVALRTRLAERDSLLVRALQELAVYRREAEPDWFIYQRSRRQPAKRART